MKHLLFILAAGLVGLCHGQPDTLINDLAYKNGKLFSGQEVVSDTSKTGRVYFTTNTYVDGDLILVETKSKDGRETSKYGLKNGLLNGLSESYYNGRLISKRFAVQIQEDSNTRVMYHGQTYWCDTLGRVKFRGYYNMGTGADTGFYETGEIESIDHLVRDRMKHITYRYYKNGQIRLWYGKHKGSRTPFKGIEYYENGKVKSKGKYLNFPRRTGKWKFYTEKGKLEKVEMYENGELIE